MWKCSEMKKALKLMWLNKIKGKKYFKLLNFNYFIYMNKKGKKSSPNLFLI